MLVSCDIGTSEGGMDITRSDWPSWMECKLIDGGSCAIATVCPKSLRMNESTKNEKNMRTIWTPGHTNDSFAISADIDLPSFRSLHFP